MKKYSKIERDKNMTSRCPDGEARTIHQDGGRWLTYGHVIASKPV
jgi:hypothetical protein